MQLSFTTTRVVDHVQSGKRLRQVREKHNVSLRRLARQMEVSASFLSDLERGRRNWTEQLWEKAITALLTNKP